jgi:hypothetical protein
MYSMFAATGTFTYVVHNNNYIPGVSIIIQLFFIRQTCPIDGTLLVISVYQMYGVYM